MKKRTAATTVVVVTAVVIVTMLIATTVTTYARDIFATIEVEGTDINVPVKCFTENDDISVIQAATDQKNMAAMMEYGGTPLIGDHRNQGFDQLYDIEPGTTLWFTYADGWETEYRLIEKDRNGINTEETLIDSHGMDAQTKYPVDYLCLYTCNPGNWRSVTITYWEPYYYFDE